MARIRSIEFIGGPLCGSVQFVPDGQDVVVWTDGAAVYQYQRDELVEGPSVR